MCQVSIIKIGAEPITIVETNKQVSSQQKLYVSVVQDSLFYMGVHY